MIQMPLLLAFAALLKADALDPGRLVAAVPMTWQIDRRIDQTNGLKTCLVQSLGRNVTAILAEAPGARGPTWSILVGFDNQLGTLRYLRINKTFYQTDKARFRGSEAEEIVARLKAPGEFVFEWARSPDSAKRGGLFLTGNFSAKAAECEDWVRGTRA